MRKWILLPAMLLLMSCVSSGGRNVRTSPKTLVEIHNRGTDFVKVYVYKGLTATHGRRIATMFGGQKQRVFLYPMELERAVVILETVGQRPHILTDPLPTLTTDVYLAIEIENRIQFSRYFIERMKK